MPTLRPSVRVLSTLLSLVLLAACGPTNAPPETGSRPTRDPRTGVLVDTGRRNVVIENSRPDLPPRAGMIVVANQEAASATVLDAATLKTLATVPVGTGPHEVAISPDGRWAVVTNYGDRAAQGSTLSVIDLTATTLEVVRTIDLGEYHRPHGIVFVSSGERLLVTSETSQRLVVVDFASGRVVTALPTNARGSHMVAAQRDGRRAWTANIADSSVTEYDIDGLRTVRTYHAAPNDEGIAVTPGGVEVWVGSNTDKTVTIIDAAKGTVSATLTDFGFPYRIGISRTGRIAVVNDPVANTIWLYDVPSRKELARLELSRVSGVAPMPTPASSAAGSPTAGPEGVTFDPIANFAYVTLHATNQVAAVDLAAKKVIAFGFTGAGPDGIAFSPMVRR